MDRTNWKFGATNHNLLVIAAQVGDIAVPIIWKALPSGGNSDQEARIALMRKLLVFFPAGKIAGLLADREFIGEEWLGWLQKQGVPFITRLKANMIARLDNGATITLGRMFKNLTEGQHSKVRGVTLGKALRLGIQAKRTSKGLVVVAVHNMETQPGEPVNLYRKRWTIECGFACLKRKGFNLEDTHLLHANRLETLMAVAAIACAIVRTIGNLAPPPKIKSHGYQANCRFTLGKHILIAALLNTEKITILITYAFSNPNINLTVV